jgi:predicted AAA+ superfamily ATPase
MKSQELIASVIDAQQAEIEKKPEGLLRELFAEIPVVENFASIITGIRRCGKSTLMIQILKKQENPIFFLNFEEPTPLEVSKALAEKHRTLRKQQKMSQEEMA